MYGEGPLHILAPLLLIAYVLLEFVPLDRFAQGGVARHVLWSFKVTLLVIGTLFYAGSSVDANVTDLWGPYANAASKQALADVLEYIGIGIFALLTITYVIVWKNRIGEDGGDTPLAPVFTFIFLIQKKIVTPTVRKVLALLGGLIVLVTVFI